MGPYFGRGVAATPLPHTGNCRKTRGRGVATHWSTTGRGCSVCATYSLAVERFERFQRFLRGKGFFPDLCFLALQRVGSPSEPESLGRVKSTPDPNTFEKYRDTPPISIAILLQKYAFLLAESSIYTTNLYHDAPPICIAMLLQKY